MDKTSDANAACRSALSQIGRRSFLWSTGGAALGLGTLGSPTIATARAAIPSGVGRKFYPDGRVRRLPGNTIICHLPQQGEHAACFNAMLDAYREAPSLRFMRKVALLPTSSYHMTVFNGLTDEPRKPETWPTDLPIDLPMEACNQAFADRLRHADWSSLRSIRMKIDPEQAGPLGGALVFRLQPLDNSERANLENMRNRLADVLRLRLPDHDTYQFHMSFGYLLRWLDGEDQQEYRGAWRRWSNAIAKAAPEIHLGFPEYCTFEDMYAFHRAFYLSQSG